MTISQARNVTGRSPVVPVMTALIALGVFVADTFTDLEIAVAVFYVAVVLLAVGFCRPRGVLYVAISCMALTFLSYTLTRVGAPRSGIINLSLSLGVIAVTAYLALRTSAAESAMHEARAQLVHFARVTTLGELATSIAHEINQPLGAIALNGAAAMRWLNANPANIAEAKGSIDEIARDASRASDIVARIRGLARAVPMERSRFDIGAAVEEIILLMRRELEGNGIALTMRLAPDLPPAHGDKVQFQQVMLNLILNGIEAISSLAGRQRDLTITAVRDGERMIRMTVRDTGVGVGSDKLNRVFDAFYTTKADGLGMGLAIARSIIESHGGRLWAVSEPSRGLEMSFTLPVDEGGTARER